MAQEMRHYASTSKMETVPEEMTATNGIPTNANSGNADNANSMTNVTSSTTKEHKHQIHATLSKSHTTPLIIHHLNKQTLTTDHHHNPNIKDTALKVKKDAAKKDAAEQHAATKNKKKLTMETVSKGDHPQ